MMQMVSPSRAKVVQVTLSAIMKYSSFKLRVLHSEAKPLCIPHLSGHFSRIFKN